MYQPKSVVTLAIDGLEALVVLGARALGAVFALSESPRQNAAVDYVHEEAQRRAALRAQEPCVCAPMVPTEARPEASAGRPRVSVGYLTADDFESAAFACRKYAESAQFGGAQLHWRDIAERLDSFRALLDVIHATPKKEASAATEAP
jgi:hypothetical protein